MGTNPYGYGGLYPWQTIQSKESTYAGQDLEIFKRHLEAMSGSPVDVQSDEMSGAVQVLFRAHGIYIRINSIMFHHSLEQAAEEAMHKLKMCMRSQKEKIYNNQATSAPPPKQASKEHPLFPRKPSTPKVKEPDSYTKDLQKQVTAWLA
jgi:hypothetical protein